MKTTDGNDTIIGTYESDSAGAETARSTLNLADIVDGGAGTDTLAVTITGADTSNFALPASTKNIEVISVNNVASAASTTVDASAVAGVTNLNVTNSVKGITAKAAATTDVNVAIAEQDGAVAVNGGKNVTVNVTDAVATAAGNTVIIGAGAAANQPAGAVKVTQTLTSTGEGAALAGGPITVNGGKTVDVNVNATINVANKDASFGLNAGTIAVNSNAATEAVTVKQTGTVNKFQQAATTAPATTGTTSVKFAALAVDEAVTVGDLTFTAKVALTAGQVAAAFANLTAADKQSSGGVVTNGVYSGVLGASYTSAAANGDTVVFAGNKTDATFATGPATKAPVTTYTAGPDVVTPGTAVGGAVALGQVNIAGAAALKTVSVDGYNVAGSTITGANNKALADVTLANGGAVAIESAAETLNLGLTAVNGGDALTTANISVDDLTKVLNVKGTGAAVNATLTSDSVTTLNVAGTGTYAVAAAGSVLTTLKVSDSANVTTAAGIASSLTSVDTTAGTGTTNVTIDGALASYAGGAGVDNVIVTTAAVDKAINLGAGNDRLNLSAATPIIKAGLVLEGGDGTDTLVLSAAGAASVSGATTFQAQINGFEKLEIIDGSLAADIVNLDNLDDINYVVVNAGAGLKLDQMLTNATIELKGEQSFAVDVALKVPTGTADVVNLITNAADTTVIGTLTAAGAETINVTAIDTDTTAAVSTNTITVTAADATTVNVTGAGNLILALTGSTKVTLVDGSTATGNLTVATLDGVAATTVKGGAGADNLTANHAKDVLVGGAGNDFLTVADGKALVSLQGGAGKDTYKIGLVAGENQYSTISGTAAELSGDVIQFSTGGVLTVIANTVLTGVAKVELATTAVFTDYLNDAVKGGATGNVSWFQFGGNTYVAQDNTAGATFDAATDNLVEIAGLVNLTYSAPGLLEIA